MHCPNLHSLTYCSDEFPPSSESLWSLANGCRHLKHLTLPPVPDSPNAAWFNDTCLLVIAQAWSDLVSLTIGGNSITSAGLKEIGICPQLVVSLLNIFVAYSSQMCEAGVFRGDLWTLAAQRGCREVVHRKRGFPISYQTHPQLHSCLASCPASLDRYAI